MMKIMNLEEDIMNQYFKVNVKRIIVIILTLGLTLNMSELTSLAYSDEPADWAVNEIAESVVIGLIPEDLQNQYDKAITREEFCRLVINFIEIKEDTTIADYLSGIALSSIQEHPFSDTDSINVMYANKLGIANGYPDGTFKPNKAINRQEAAKMLTATAYALNKRVVAEPVTFVDQDEIGSWAIPYIQFVYEMGIMNGVSVSEERFNPQGTYQRQMAFITINRLFYHLQYAIERDFAPMSASWFFKYGLGNAGDYSYKYSTNDFNIINTTYVTESMIKTETQSMNMYGDIHEINIYNNYEDDRTYYALPNRQYMISYPNDEYSSLMSKYISITSEPLVAAYIKNDTFNYVHQVVMLPGDPYFNVYTFTFTDGELIEITHESNDEESKLYFQEFIFKTIDPSLVTIPTGYEEVTQTYPQDPSDIPFYWEMSSN